MLHISRVRLAVLVGDKASFRMMGLLLLCLAGNGIAVLGALPTIMTGKNNKATSYRVAMGKTLSSSNVFWYDEKLSALFLGA